MTRAVAQRIEFIEKYLDGVFGGDLHAKRVASLACGVPGVTTSASLAVSIIGQALAQARGKAAKHAIKQVDRLLSNRGVDVWTMVPLWIEEMIGERRPLVIAMDWTDFDADDQTTLVFSLISNHGRATPLLWFSVFKAELEGKRNDIEDMCLVRLKEALGDGVKAAILAGRGFGDAKLFGFLGKLGFEYVVRFRGGIFVTGTDGETRRAEDFIGVNGRARKLVNPLIGKGNPQRVGAAVCIGDPYRRDRMLLLSAAAIVLLTLLGAAGVALGMDRLLKSNTVKRRVHSLFRQSCLYYDAIPNMPETTLRALMDRFQNFIAENKVTDAIFRVVRKMRGCLKRAPETGRR